VKKRWEDMASQVKKKERTAKNEEIRRIRITGNGVLPDEVFFYLNCRNHSYCWVSSVPRVSRDMIAIIIILLDEL